MTDQETKIQKPKFSIKTSLMSGRVENKWLVRPISDNFSQSLSRQWLRAADR